jgi:hypothetical protein
MYVYESRYHSLDASIGVIWFIGYGLAGCEQGWCVTGTQRELFDERVG